MKTSQKQFRHPESSNDFVTFSKGKRAARIVIELGSSEAIITQDINKETRKTFIEQIFKEYDEVQTEIESLDLSSEAIETQTQDRDEIDLKTFKYVVNGDIAKMYRMIEIHPDHTDYQRIVWRENTEDPLKTYRLTTLTYGTKPASFIATRCLKELALQNVNQYPEPAKAIQQDFYVDDLLTGGDSLENLITLRDQIIQILAHGGFLLRKWAANHPALIPNSHEPNLNVSFDKDAYTKTLGLFWNPNHDSLRYQVKQCDIPKRLTKREILQQCWSLKIGWDDLLPEVKPSVMYPIMGNLPKSRVEPTRPFSISGEDYAGPIYIKECRGRSKRTVKAYICVFVCFSTKAVHLELVGDLTTQTFLNALKRFISRRNDPNDLNPITPGHFLIGEPLTSISERDLTTTRINRLTQWQRVEQMRQHFWYRWQREYLVQNINRFKQLRGSGSRPSTPALEVGSIVILVEDNTPPLQWKLGRIVELHPRSDGVVRVVSAKLQQGKVARACHPALHLSAANSNNSASDLGKHGPASPRRLRPRQGVSRYNNPARNAGAGPSNDPDSSSDDAAVALPFHRRSCGVCLNSGKRNYQALSLADEIRHVSERHPYTQILYKCTNCLKEYKTKHATLCHMPKCTGRAPAPQGNVLKCQQCGLVCTSKSGLTQHTRHRHPALRNEQRAAAELDRALRAARSRTRNPHVQVFTDEEVRLILELEVKFRKRKFVAKDMEPYFPNKTNKQLRDKRNMASYKQTREEYLAGLGIPTLSDVEESESSEGEEDDPVTEKYLDAEDAYKLSSPEVPAGEIGSSGSNSIDNGWSERIKTAALKHSLPEKAISQEPAPVIQELQGALRETANGFLPQARLDEIYEQILNYLVSKDRKTKDKRQRNRDRGRRAIRRHVYPRTQDIFKRNPGQLAQHVREDKLLIVQKKFRKDYQQVAKQRETFLQPSEQFEQKDHRMLHASIEQRLQTNLTEQKTLRTPTRRICTIQHEDYILQEFALHSLQERRGRDIREFPASAQNKTQCPEGSPRNDPNVFAEGQFGVEDDTQISN
ncbi:hypothetical protein GEV33_007571 [Tenebrio molitor]|uniref:C2H2-type domain-containing protein n=1 Tax=Tenebrio molitor TaxID=7067 RepID=A0A8J6HIE8_TENMO|nr:hypothetical protein GEV33_007571 [Tenebrio molitor]